MGFPSVGQMACFGGFASAFVCLAVFGRAHGSVQIRRTERKTRSVCIQTFVFIQWKSKGVNGFIFLVNIFFLRSFFTCISMCFPVYFLRWTFFNLYLVYWGAWSQKSAVWSWRECGELCTVVMVATLNCLHFPLKRTCCQKIDINWKTNNSWFCVLFMFI